MEKVYKEDGSWGWNVKPARCGADLNPNFNFEQYKKILDSIPKPKVEAIVTTDFCTKGKVYEMFWDDEDEFFIRDDNGKVHGFTMKNQEKWFKRVE